LEGEVERKERYVKTYAETVKEKEEQIGELREKIHQVNSLFLITKKLSILFKLG